MSRKDICLTIGLTLTTGAITASTAKMGALGWALLGGAAVAFLFAYLFRKATAALRGEISDIRKIKPQYKQEGRIGTRLDFTMYICNHGHATTAKTITVSIQDRAGRVYTTSGLQRGEDKFDYSKVLATGIPYTSRPTIYVDEVDAFELDLTTLKAEITDGFGRSHVIPAKPTRRDSGIALS